MPAKKIKVPVQKRSIATKNKLKNAAKRLFALNGFYKVTSIQIADKANVPVGSFYNYFGDKKGMILELVKDFNTEYHNHTFSHLRSIVNDLNSIDDVLKSIEDLLEVSLLSKHLADPFFGIIHSLQFTEKSVLELSEEIRKSELDLLHEFLEKINTFHPIENISIKAKLIHSTAENVSLYIHHLGTKFEKKQLISETTKMLYSYLL